MVTPGQPAPIADWKLQTGKVEKFSRWVVNEGPIFLIGEGFDLFKAAVAFEVYILKKEEGGRHTPFFTGYRPQFYFRTTDVTGNATLPEGVEMVMPGDNIKMQVELITPIAMEEGLRFAIREGGRTVGAGVVAKIHE